MCPFSLMRPRVRLVALLMLGMTAISSAQLGLGVLQLTAWSTMLVSYAKKTNSIQQAVALTFDGQHRCSLCEEVTRRTSEQTAPDEVDRPSVNMPWGLPNRNPFIIGRDPGRLMALGAMVSPTGKSPPALPPPRRNFLLV